MSGTLARMRLILTKPPSLQIAQTQEFLQILIQPDRNSLKFGFCQQITNTITSSQLRRLQTSLLKRIQCQFMTCILSALFPCSCELNGRGPYYSEAGREPIRSTELSTGSSASVSVHSRVPQQFSPYCQLN